MNTAPEQNEGQPPEPENTRAPNTVGRRVLKVALIILVGIPLLIIALALLVLGACFISSL